MQQPLAHELLTLWYVYIKARLEQVSLQRIGFVVEVKKKSKFLTGFLTKLYSALLHQKN